MTSKRGIVVFSLLFSLVIGIGTVRAQAIVINEIMASNQETLRSESGEASDWIELYNPSSAAVSLAGLYLSDSLDNVTKWQFPTDKPVLTTLPAQGYLIVWASGGESTETELHAAFSLSADGEIVILTQADGVTEIDRVQFERQYGDVSYGRQPSDRTSWAFLSQPTPGQANEVGYAGVTEPVQFSAERGFYDQPISLSLSTDTADAEIWYTLNADTPQASGDTSERYTGPIDITATTCVRAVAVKADWQASVVVSQTYLYLEDVIHQPNRPDGFPRRWGGRNADYEMDDRVVEDPEYSGTLKDDLKSTPVVCLTIPNDDFFNGSGIYANPTRSGDAWERAASMEWIDPNTGEQFGVNAGLRIHGGPYSRSGNPKNALRLVFRGEYGLSKLDYPLFPDSDVQTFNVLALRSIWNYSWSGDSTAAGGLGPSHADYLRDVFARDTIRDMQRLTPHGRPIQVYINGLYWGLYIMTERPDETFAADHLGGAREDYQVLEAPSGVGSSTTMQVKAGGDQAVEAWEELFDLAEADLRSYAAYVTLQNLIDVPSLIDYMLTIYYTGSRDAPVFLGDSRTPRNFYAARRNELGSPFVLIPWDVEWSLESPTINRVQVVGVSNPHVLMDRLAENEEYRVLLADHIYRHFFNDGVLTRERTTQRYLDRAAEIHGAIVGESARWGDARSFQPFTRRDWEAEVDRLVNQFFAVRTDIVLDQLKAHGWYPSLDPPVYRIDGQDQHGGYAASAASLTLANPNGSGTVYYTLDGTDPRRRAYRQPGAVFTLLPERSAKRILVPSGDLGSQWQGGSEPFDDELWTHGTPTLSGGQGAVGFAPSGDRGPGSEYRPLISYDVGDDMRAINGSCLIRIPFQAEAADLQLMLLILRVRSDDGFVAYLNGTEVASLGKPPLLTWDSVSTEVREDSGFLDFDISEHIALLREGTNILAVQALNRSADDAGFLFSTEMLALADISIDPGPASAHAEIYEDPIALTESQHIQSRVYSGGQWSALNETLFGVGRVAENLRISEVMYHPQNADAEFVEVTNIGSESLNLNLVTFTRGIEFTFPSLDLAPQAAVVVIRDIEAFTAVYGPDVPVAGQFQGNLDNAGERLALQDAGGTVIHDFRYRDDWYPVTDGGGSSLEVINPSADTVTWSLPASWGASPVSGGTPGQ